MGRIIRKVAVLGAGIMGSRLACHFANAGLDVLLLGRAPHEPNADEKEKGLKIDDPEVRNRLVNLKLREAIQSDPSPLFIKKNDSKIKAGTVDHDMPLIRDCDWVLEAVTEDTGIKKSIFEKIDHYRTPGTLVTTNTSCLPLQSLCEGRSADFSRHFCGTHFFNPPRYLSLMEIIPAPTTDPEVTGFLKNFGDLFLGKNPVLCKDTPGFIANRVGIFAVFRIMEIMDKFGLNIDEIDKLTGPAAGMPKSATFRTMDIVGLDTIINVAENIYRSVQDDNYREMHKPPDILYDLRKRNWLGDKTQQGFYKKVKNRKGETTILTLDFRDFKYKPKKKTRLQTLESAKRKDAIGERINILYNGKDKAGEFYRLFLQGLFEFVSLQVPGICDELFKIDESMRAGFGWESGPFELWENLGIEKIISDMDAAGIKPAAWVRSMISQGHKSFYSIDKGSRKYFDIPSGAYQSIPGKEGMIILEHARLLNLVWENSGTSLIDLGDGILNIEFHTKRNIMGREVVEGINKGLETAEKSFRGAVIGNQGRDFTVGVNLGILFMLAIEQDYEEIDSFVKIFQNTMMRVRHSGIPVIVASRGLCLGGGCEMSLHADHVQAAAETYIGLVEARVGLLPAGGGTKEMTYRGSAGLDDGDVSTDAMMEILKNLVDAKVAASAYEAYDLNYLGINDSVSMNADRVISDAKSAAIRLAELGYRIPDPSRKIKVMGRPGVALFLEKIASLKKDLVFTGHDAKIAQKIAWIMNGGDMNETCYVSEQYLLDLEREAFLSLCGERKTLERIDAILRGGKALRN